MATFDLQPLHRRAAFYDPFPMPIDLTLERERSSGPRYDFEWYGDNRYRITLELPGFSKDDIDIVQERNLLAVRGCSTRLTAKDWLYHGITGGEFEQVFDLADHVEITGATLSNGLLVIALKHELPEAYKPRRIPIRTNTMIGAGGTVTGIIDQVAHHAARARQGLEQLFQSARRAIRAGGPQELNHARYAS